VSLSSRSPTSGIFELLAGVLPQSAAGDAVESSRRGLFVAAHLATAVAGFAALPLFLLFRGVPDLFESLVFVGFLLPLLVALAAARTRRLPHLLSIAGTSVLIGAACLTGASAVALPLLALIPAQAALGGSIRMVALSLVAVLSLAAGLALAPDAFGGAPSVPAEVLAGAVGAAVLVAVFAGAQAMLQAGTERWAAAAEERASLVGVVPDLVTRHDRSGRVTFASMPASRRLLGVAARELFGDGLFGRVQVADRPAYLAAIAGARDGEGTAVTELRLGSGGADGALAYAWFEMRCEPAGETLACSFRDIDEQKQLAEAESGHDGAEAAGLRRLGEHLRALRREVETGASADGLLRRLDRLALLAEVSVGEPTRAIEAFDCGLSVRNACDAAVPLARISGVALNGAPLRRLPKVAGAPRAFRRALDLLIGECIGCAGAGGEVGVALERGAEQIRIGLTHLAGPAATASGPDGLAVELAGRLLGASGATLAHEDRPGQGGRFTIRLPLGARGAEAGLRPAGAHIIGEREFGVAKRA
jgi:cell cycle sensor histidine kinase DivJ